MATAGSSKCDVASAGDATASLKYISDDGRFDDVAGGRFSSSSVGKELARQEGHSPAGDGKTREPHCGQLPIFILDVLIAKDASSVAENPLSAIAVASGGSRVFFPSSFRLTDKPSAICLGTE